MFGLEKIGNFVNLPVIHHHRAKEPLLGLVRVRRTRKTFLSLGRGSG
jgi:hypothetical protein